MEVPEVIWDKIAVRCVVWMKVVARAHARPGTSIVHTHITVRSIAPQSGQKQGLPACLE
jgi:hypothetical protein